MIFDSAVQKQRVLDMIGEVPISTDVKGLIAGASQGLLDLVGRIKAAQVMSVEDQTAMMIYLEERKSEPNPDD